MDYIGVSGEQSWRAHQYRNGGCDSVHCFPASHYADRYPTRTIRDPQPSLCSRFFPISLLMSRSFSMLIIAFIIRGFKEFGDTSRKALIIGYSESQRRGQMIGAYYLVRDLIVSAGAILGAYLWKLGPALNFSSQQRLFGIAGTIFYVKTIRQSRQLALNDLKKSAGDASDSLEVTGFNETFSAPPLMPTFSLAKNVKATLALTVSKMRSYEVISISSMDSWLLAWFGLCDPQWAMDPTSS